MKLQLFISRNRPRQWRPQARTLAIPSLTFFAALPVYAQSTGSDPWDNAVNVLKTAFTGTIATGLSLVAIVVGGLMFAYGEGQSKRMLAGIIFGIGMAVGAVKFSYGEYWTDNAAAVYARMEDAMYDGPPFGATLKNWLRYSVSFTLQSIHTPLLMEAMGYGIRDNHPGEIPFNLVPRFELLAGLTALSKPVEMYYYPDETHEPNHPKARLASLERNIDWYRFWLQGYERPFPALAKQYKRWEGLKKLHQMDLERHVAPTGSDDAATN